MKTNLDAINSIEILLKNEILNMQLFIARLNNTYFDIIKSERGDYMFNTIQFGKYLSYLRKTRDLTQSEVADKLNLTRQAVSRYETGDSFPDVSILVELANIYEVSFADLINAGNPTLGESIILTSIANKSDDVIVNDVKDLENLAPLIKPSVLERLSKNLLDDGIDISSFINLTTYLSDEAVVDFVCDKKIANMDNNFIEKLIPLLDGQSKMRIFDKILNSELSYKLIRNLCQDYHMYELVEAAVVEGGLPFESLKYAKIGINEAREK